MDDRHHLAQHHFYEPVAPDGEPPATPTLPAPAVPHPQQDHSQHPASGHNYQVVKDELRRILLGVVSQLVNPKWWLYGLLEELGASKAFLKQFRGMSDRQIRTALLRSQLTRPTRFAILKRDNYTCHYCHRTGVPLEVDHVVPLYKGGTNDPSNLVAACHNCNHSKGIQDA